MPGRGHGTHAQRQRASESSDIGHILSKQESASQGLDESAHGRGGRKEPYKEEGRPFEGGPEQQDSGRGS
jgi:hypothetical protein